MTKRKLAVSLVLNTIIFLGALWGLIAILFGIGTEAFGLNLFEFFTEDSNILLLAASLVMIIFDALALAKGRKVPHAANVLKFIATVAEVLTFLVVACYLIPINFDTDGFAMWSFPHMAFVHFIDPVLAFVSFALFEKDERWNKKPLQALYPLIYVLIYGVIVTILVALPNSTVEPPYPFMAVTQNPWYVTVLAYVGMVAGTYLMGFLILLCQGFVAKKEAVKAVKDTAADKDEKPVEAEKKDEQPTETAKKEEEKPTETKESAAQPTNDSDVPVIEDTDDDEASEEAKEAEEEKQAQSSDPNNYMNRPRVYHISKQDSGQWQVKLATGQKAIKLFNTQEEAITYAKSLVKTQGGSIRVHSLKGKMRKD